MERCALLPALPALQLLEPPVAIDAPALLVAHRGNSPSRGAKAQSVQNVLLLFREVNEMNPRDGGSGIEHEAE